MNMTVSIVVCIVALALWILFSVAERKVADKKAKQLKEGRGEVNNARGRDRYNL